MDLNKELDEIEDKAHEIIERPSKVILNGPTVIGHLFGFLREIVGRLEALEKVAGMNDVER